MDIGRVIGLLNTPRRRAGALAMVLGALSCLIGLYQVGLHRQGDVGRIIIGGYSRWSDAGAPWILYGFWLAMVGLFLLFLYDVTIGFAIRWIRHGFLATANEPSPGTDPVKLPPDGVFPSSTIFGLLDGKPCSYVERESAAFDWSTGSPKRVSVMRLLREDAELVSEDEFRRHIAASQRLRSKIKVTESAATTPTMTPPDVVAHNRTLADKLGLKAESDRMESAINKTSNVEAKQWWSRMQRAAERSGFVLSDRFTLAIQYAGAAHAGQLRRGTNTPYAVHLISAAALILEYGGNEDQAIAGLLHDVIEDCGADHAAIIREKFGDTVADIVLACTDGTAESKAKPTDPEAMRRNWWIRKLSFLENLRGKSDATLLVSGCDKLANALAIVADLENPAVGPAVFNRFTGSKDGTLRYYHSVAKLLATRKVTVATVLEATVTRMHQLAGGIDLDHGIYRLRISDTRWWIDEDEAHDTGWFFTATEAIAEARSMVEASLAAHYRNGMNAAELITAYSSRQEEPSIIGTPELSFSAGGYAAAYASDFIEEKTADANKTKSRQTGSEFCAEQPANGLTPSQLAFGITGAQYQEASFPCSVCAQPAGEIRLFHDKTYVTAQCTFAGDLFIRVASSYRDAVHLAMDKLDALTLFKIDLEFTPFYCPECDANYCKNHWRTYTVFDEDASHMFDCIRGTCPNGHQRTLED